MLMALVVVLFFFAAPIAAEEKTSVAPTPVASPAAALNVVDLRYSTSVQYAEYFRVDGKLIAPDVYVLNLPSAGYQEVGVGGGYTLYTDDNVTLSGLVYFAVGSGGERYIEPAVGLTWQEGQVAGSVFASYAAPVSQGAPWRILIDPADVEFKFDPRWSAGVSLTAFQLQGTDWTTKLGPIVRYRDGAGFWEVRAAQVNPGGYLEVQVRKVLEF
jgi:hypothetical protein